MRIAVFGVGGVGGYFGGKLAQAREDVVFIARGDHLKAIKTNGLSVQSPQGNFVINPAHATNNPEEVGEVDIVILGVKTWQVEEAVETIRPLIGLHTAVLTLQNGVEAPQQVARILGDEHVLAGICRVIASIEAPGKVRYAGRGEPYIGFNEWGQHEGDRVQSLYQAFTRTDVRAEITPDIHEALWMKFLFITPWSGIGAVTRTPVGVWRNIPETRTMVTECLQEILTVAQSQNVSLPKDAVETTWAMYERTGSASTASLQRDIMANRPSELEAQIGAVVRFGQQSSIPTPAHTFIYSSLLPLESLARGEAELPG